MAPNAIIDWVYVDNVVLDHLLCETKLIEEEEGNAEEFARGEAFCISNEEPMSLENFYLQIQFFFPSSSSMSLVSQRRWPRTTLSIPKESIPINT